MAPPLLSCPPQRLLPLLSSFPRLLPRCPALPQALPAILKWGLASEGVDGRLAAVPLPEALQLLDSVLDSLFEFRVRGLERRVTWYSLSKFRLRLAA